MNLLTILKNYLVRIKKEKVGIVLAFLVFVACWPFFFWQYERAYVFSCLLIFFVSIFNIDVETKNRRWTIFYFVLIYFLLGFCRGTSAWPIYFAYALIPCLKIDVLSSTYRSFRFLIIIVFSLSLVNLLLLLFGVSLPSQNIEPLNTLKPYGYIQYPFIIFPMTAEDGAFSRFCSVFDEPGVVGTLAGMILCVEKYSMHKIGNIILLIAGLLSMSLYFFVISFLFVLLQTKTKKIFILCVIGFCVYILTSNIDFFNDYLWNRLVMTDDGKFQGDNRNSTEFLRLFNNSFNDIRIILGYGSDYVKNYQESASIQLFILRDGILFVLLFLIGYINLAFKYIKPRSRLLFFLIFLVGTLYQRPGFCNPEFLLLFSSFIFYDKFRKFSTYIRCSC